MAIGWTIEYWKQLLADQPGIVSAIWHDPDSEWPQAKQHNTYLHMMILMGGLLSPSDEEDIEIAMLLLTAGADPNSQNDLGKTPLHLVCELDNRDAELVEVLLKFGADPQIMTHDGCNALDLLDSAPESDVIRQLIEKYEN